MGDDWSIIKMLHFLQELSQLRWFICKVGGSTVELEEADTGVWRTELQGNPQSRMASCSLCGHSMRHGDPGLTVEASKSSDVPGAYRMSARS